MVRGRGALPAPGEVARFHARGFDVFFNSNRAQIAGDLVANLTGFIAKTEATLDCAIYDLRAPEVLQALAGVHQAGKKLRIAYDGGPVRTGGVMADPKPPGTEQAIKDAGLDSVATAVHLTGRHLMHDKFLIRDHRHVWTGSANFTTGGLELQDNNCLAISSAPLARAYQPVFDDLVTAPLTPASAQTEKPLRVAGVTITPYFAPAAGEGVDQLSVRLLGQAAKLRLLFFVMSDPDILGTLAARFSQPGADVRGIYDPNGMRNVTKSKTLPPGSFWFMSDSRFLAAPSHPFTPTGENDFMHNEAGRRPEQSPVELRRRSRHQVLRDQRRRATGDDQADDRGRAQRAGQAHLHPRRALGSLGRRRIPSRSASRAEL